MKYKIALILYNIKNLQIGGGLERQFTSYYKYRKSIESNNIELVLLTDNGTYKELNKIGFNLKDNVIISLGSYTNNFFLKLFFALLWNIQLIHSVIKERIDLIHIPYPPILLFPALWILDLFKSIKLWKGNICLNIVSCYLAHDYFNSVAISKRELKIYKFFFEKLKLDGIFSWYKLFKDKSSKMKFLGTPYIDYAKYYFVENIEPNFQKENIVVFASRMTNPKNPKLYIQTVKYIYDNYYSIITKNNWSFLIYGGGEIEKEVDALIVSLGLSNHLKRCITYDMKPIFAKTKIFVSLQDIENFTSLSLLEAMSAGNAIICMDVGETQRIVQNGINGFLCKEFSVVEIAHNIIKLMNDENLINNFSYNNIKLSREIFNIKNFANDIESFWINVINKN